MGFLDGLTLDACELTNEWYFDVMMQVVYKAKSATLPNETILAAPKTDKEIKFHYENYVSQILQNTRRWDMRRFVENKTYEIEGRQCKGIIKQHNNSINVSFYPENGTEEKRKPKWKFW
jgi:hypothetical protein